MANEREIKVAQADRLYDLLEALDASETEREKVLVRQMSKIEAGMTIEEVGYVKNLFATAKAHGNGTNQ